MPAPQKTAQFDIANALLEAFATNNRINIYLVEQLPDAAWRAKGPDGKGRDIASIFAHIHNVRLMWLKSADPSGALPGKVEAEVCSKAEVKEALTISWQSLERLLAESLRGDGKIRGFKPDAAGFLAYLLAHDAHHRGQITMLARQAGHPVSQGAMFGLWQWGTR